MSVPADTPADRHRNTLYRIENYVGDYQSGRPTANAIDGFARQALNEAYESLDALVSELADLRAEKHRLQSLLHGPEYANRQRNVEQVGPDVHEFCKEEIAELRAENERLTAERDENLDFAARIGTTNFEAECVTLRQALAHIQSMAGHPDAARGCRNIIAAVRAVLATSTHEPA